MGWVRHRPGEIAASRIATVSVLGYLKLSLVVKHGEKVKGKGPNEAEAQGQRRKVEG